jgi:hypothetical protein
MASMTADQLAYVRMQLSDPGSSAVQTLLIIGATSGTFTISYAGQTTSALAYNATPGDVQNALAALSNVGLGNVMVNNGPNNGSTINNTAPYSIYFVGTLANAAQPVITVDSSGLVGVGIIVTIMVVALGGVYAFTDAELNLNYGIAKLNVNLGVMYDYRALAADLSRLNDYVAGQSQEKKSQVFDQVRQQAEFWEQWAQADRQVQFASLVRVPPPLVAYPWSVGVPSTSLQYLPPYGPGPWGVRRRG